MGSILSVLVLAIGLYITNSANRSQQDLAAQSQITERFTSAIEQLGQAGGDKIDVRLGAIYALERIMRDSAADHPAVVDILTAFLRVHAPNKAGSPAIQPSPREAENTLSPPVDIQAALTVLGRRNPVRDSGDVDLSYTDLRGANLSHGRFSDADLSGANLAGSNLFLTNLNDAELKGADLRGAWIRNANLVDSDLSDANLAGADLGDTNLRYAWINGANFAGANLTNARVSRGQLRCASVDKTTHLPEKLEKDTWRDEVDCESS
ncbi:pentapeptide repeat-containing protein [Micromonospora sp. WMMB235]|uniref:pentapeptide repeat-containing protein n=1 Tax=Micromonospora sp. WMMB235 TaxID=1172030 RepID=UPI00115FE1B7|nr:pentapeptide repeat-containing protein [Micromonospora sp. WMMB235]